MTRSTSARPVKTLILECQHQKGDTLEHNGIKYSVLSSSKSCSKGKFDVRVTRDFSGKEFKLETSTNEILDSVMELQVRAV